MAFIYRAMLREGNQPAVGRSAKMLGVRLLPHSQPDIVPDESGFVAPNSGGMSVTPDWKSLPTHRLPRRLRTLVPDASGSNELACWRLSALPFATGPVSLELQLRIDGETHGLVEPIRRMPFSSYENALAETRDLWIIDEA